MRMKWGEKGSNDENGEMMEDDLYWLIAGWKKKKKGEGRRRRWRRRGQKTRARRCRPGSLAKAVVERRVDHMLAIFSMRYEPEED